MKNLTKKHIKIIFILLILIIFLFFCFYFFILNITNKKEIKIKDEYIYSIKRDNYIIKNVDEALINIFANYIPKEKNTLIVFFATWCQACVEESEELNKFITNNPNIPVIVVSFDKKVTDLENYLLKNKYNWFTFFDPTREIRKLYDIDTKGIPATYLVNNNFNVISKKISSMTEEELLNFYNLNN